MAYLTKKGERYYICESYQVAKLDDKGLPSKDKDNKAVYKNEIKWTPSSKNKKLAEIELGKYEEDKDRGRIGLDKKHTSWQEIKGKYLTYSKSTKARASFLLDELLFAKIEEFCPSISSVNDLSMSFAEKFLEWLKEVKGNSEGTCVRRFSTLKNIGKKLVEWDILQINPLQKLKVTKVRNEKEIKYWTTAEEISKIIENTNGVWRTISYMGFFIGARISEILNIKWADVDFINSKIRIQSSGTFRTKSRRFRIIPMPDMLKEYLLKLKKEQSQNAKIKVDNVVVYRDGTIPTMQSCSSYLRKKYKEIGFKGYHAHCLRHTFAAHYLKKHKDIYGLSKILGHHSVTITEQYYGHLVPNYFDKTMPNFNPLRCD
ncbi:MAG: tyrosine-type recombinase/integrase [Endomicrobium sp.]|jgi:integrase|nr:tyrosine-type recombinase/integrase [Endomicrobium sp.]